MAIVAEITSNLATAGDPAFLSIDISTPEGTATGLTQNSVVGCLFLATVAEARVQLHIGRLSDRDWAEVRARVTQVFNWP